MNSSSQSVIWTGAGPGRGDRPSRFALLFLRENSLVASTDVFGFHSAKIGQGTKMAVKPKRRKCVCWGGGGGV